MAKIALQAGEAVRIHAGERVLLVTHAGATWEIRVLHPGLIARVAAWWRARRQQALLEELDPRTLRDVGLTEFAARIEERRAFASRLQLS